MDYYPSEDYLVDYELNNYILFRGQYSITNIDYDGFLDNHHQNQRLECVTVTTVMCPWGDDHPAGPACQDKELYTVSNTYCWNTGVEYFSDGSEDSHTNVGGGGGGGGTTSTNNDPNTDPTNTSNETGDNESTQDGFTEDGGETIETTPILVKPPIEETDPHLDKLKELTDNSKIKAKIAELLGKVTTNNEEDGAQYDQIGTTPLTFEEVLPDSTNYTKTHFPALRSNTKVTVHLHTDDVTVDGVDYGLIPVFSDGDIDSFIADSAELDDDEYTSILVSEAGVLALRITDLDRLKEVNEKLNNNDSHVKKLYDTYKYEVIKNSNSDTPEKAVKRLLNFLNVIKFDDDHDVSGIGASLYQAMIINGVVIGWQKVTN